MKKEKHPLETINKWLDERGLAVLENVTTMPTYDEPYVSPNLVIALNQRGWVRADYDMQPIKYLAYDHAVVYPGHILTAYESSDDYLCTLLVISPRFLKILNQLHPKHYLFEFHLNSSFHMTKSQFETMLTCFKMLKNLSQLDHPERDEMLIMQMDITARIVRNCLRENGKEMIHKETAVQQLLSRFHEDVVKHYRESREVRFYAKLQNLTPKYFGTVIRDATGIGVGEWIANYVIIQAKFMLRHQSNLTIQQISNQLGFTEQTTFSRYFKTYAGMSPKEYRET
ncbi:MAG: AraC family transcriptional regulator [Bacteroidaceae bacterium]|nr:AraC family transcriptional regulator [Bacteroidaceae bacterium]